jgi:hypothetical protein
MKKSLITLLFCVCFNTLFACSCITEKLISALASADFVATAKIIKVIPDGLNPTYKNITLELINVYKGERLTSIRVDTRDETSCEFSIPINSTWLIFAGKNADGTLGFGPCSKSEQIDINHTDSLAKRNHLRSTELKLKVLGYLRDAKINPVNIYQLRPEIHRQYVSKFSGANVTGGEFAIYQLTVGTNLGIQKIRTLKNWKDPKLNAELPAYLKSKWKIYKSDKDTQIPQTAKLILIFYAYPAEGGYESFVTDYDL